MEATNFLPTSPTLPHRPSSTDPRKNNGLINMNVTKKPFTINAKQGDQNDDQGKSVDENMTVLKMRIKKSKVLESSGGGTGTGSLLGVAPAALPSSSDWTEWEKRVFTRYHEGVCDWTEMLQSYLMNTRPSVALGTLALLAMSVPFSSSVVLVNALKVARGLLAGCHVSIDIDF